MAKTSAEAQLKSRLPEWATLGGENASGLRIINVDGPAAYAALLAEMKVEPDQFWLETAYQCIKLDCQVAMRGFAFEIRIHDRDKRFQQSKFPKGRGADAATFGREAREAYRRMRGFVPS